MAYSNGFMIILPHNPKTSLKLKKKNMDNTQYCQRCGTTGTFLHSYWGYKIVRPLLKTVGSFFIKNLHT